MSPKWPSWKHTKHYLQSIRHSGVKIVITWQKWISPSACLKYLNTCNIGKVITHLGLRYTEDKKAPNYTKWSVAIINWFHPSLPCQKVSKFGITQAGMRFMTHTQHTCKTNTMKLCIVCWQNQNWLWDKYSLIVIKNHRDPKRTANTSWKFLGVTRYFSSKLPGSWVLIYDPNRQQQLRYSNIPCTMGSICLKRNTNYKLRQEF